MEMLILLLSDMYNLFRVKVDMEDVGHSGASRKRVYIICALKTLRTLADPVRVSEVVFEVLKGRFQTSPSDYMGASRLEVQLEAAEVCRVRHIQYRVTQDLRYILNRRERDVVATLNTEFERRYPGKRPHGAHNLIYFLGDNPSWSITWSATSNKIPCLRRNSSTGKLWIPSKNRWLTATERLLTGSMISEHR